MNMVASCSCHYTQLRSFANGRASQMNVAAYGVRHTTQLHSLVGSEARTMNVAALCSCYYTQLRSFASENARMMNESALCSCRCTQMRSKLGNHAGRTTADDAMDHSTAGAVLCRYQDAALSAQGDVLCSSTRVGGSAAWSLADSAVRVLDGSTARSLAGSVAWLLGR